VKLRPEPGYDEWGWPPGNFIPDAAMIDPEARQAVCQVGADNGQLGEVDSPGPAIHDVDVSEQWVIASLAWGDELDSTRVCPAG